jgi:hypothetical protein
MFDIIFIRVRKDDMTKILIASGCSYTEGPYNWPSPLASLLNCELKNYGESSVGNGRISRSVIYGVSEALKSFDNSEILVGIVWSGKTRREFYQSNIDYSTISHVNVSNPHGFINSENNWVTVNHHWNDFYSKEFYKYFHDDVESDILTLEHILRTQWFLEKHNIKYFMSTFAPGVLPSQTNNSTQHLLDLIDFSKFLKVKSVMEWCIEDSGLPLSEYDRSHPHLSIYAMHPTPDHSKKFAEEVILPFIRG